MLVRVLTVTCIVLAAAPGAAETPPPGEPATEKAADDWGDVEAVEAAAATAAPAAPRTGLKAIVGYFHAASTHMPIGFVFLLIVLDALCLLGRQPALYRAGYIAMLLAFAAFVPAIVTGLTRFSVLGLDGADAAHALKHRNLMLAAAGMMLAAVITRWPAKNDLVGIRRHLYLGFLAVTAALLTIGGHEGGEMVYGDIPGL